MPLEKIKAKKINTWAWFRSILFGISFILVASINDNPKETSKAQKESRHPTSFLNKKSFSLQPLLRHTEKLATPIITQIKSNSRDITQGDTFTLTGLLKTSSIMKNVEVNWLLPEELSIINGSKKSFITSAEPGQEYQFQITVKANTPINQIVHLVAKSQNGNTLFSNSSQFHTKLQSELDRSHEELYLRSKKYIEANN